MIIATATGTLGIGKAMSARHEKELTLWLTSSVLLFAAAIFLLATPVVYRAVGAITSPNLSGLLVPVATLACVAHAHWLTQLWQPDRRTQVALRRAAMIWGPVYGGAIVLMVGLYATADLGPAAPLRFAAAYAHVPQVVAFQLVYTVALITTVVATVRQCRALALPGRPDFAGELKKSVGFFALALGFDLVNVAITLTAMVGVATGHAGLGDIAETAWLATICSCIAANWGLGRMVVPTLLEEFRDDRVLEPLWKTVTDGAPGVILAPRSWWNRLNTRVTLGRRITEVRDGEKHLSPWWSVVPGLAVEYFANEVTSQEDRVPGDQHDQAWDLVAAKDAATLLYAAQLRRRIAAPTPQQGERLMKLPGMDVSISEERAHLVRVARHLTHPTVLQAVKLAHAKAASTVQG
ncbi:DUF6545 domain-containing protein [Streptomyces phaeochromogenes]